MAIIRLTPFGNRTGPGPGGIRARGAGNRDAPASGVAGCGAGVLT